MDFEDFSAVLEFAPLLIVALFSIIGSARRRKPSRPAPSLPRQPTRQAPPPASARGPGRQTTQSAQTASSALEALLREYSDAEPEEILERSRTEAARPETEVAREGEIQRGTGLIAAPGADERRAAAATAAAAKRYWRKRLSALREPAKAREAIVLSEIIGKPKAFQKPFS